jgi:peptide/nickel transport system permease protein
MKRRLETSSSSPRHFDDLVRARLWAGAANRLSIRFLLLLATLAGLAPLLASDRPLYLPTAAGARFPLFAALGTGEIFGLAATAALWTLVLAPRRGRNVALIMIGAGLALGFSAEPFFDARPYALETGTRRDLSALDAQTLDASLSAPEMRDRYLDFLEAMPLLTRLSIEVEDRVDILEAGQREALGDRVRRLQGLAAANREKLDGLEAAWFPLVPFAPDRPGLKPYRGPGHRHWLGTDSNGRDLLSRLLHGARHTLGLAFATTALAATIGLILGGLAGWRGGRIDWVIARLTDTASALPGLLLVVIATAYLAPSATARTLGLVFLLAAVAWVLPARFVRAAIASLREQDFVVAAEALGLGSTKIFFRHLLPNASTALLVAASSIFAAVIITEAGLSFLGLGVPGAASWGQSLLEAREASDLGGAWHLATFPGLLIFVTVVAVNHLSDALRDAGDPKSEA